MPKCDTDIPVVISDKDWPPQDSGDVKMIDIAQYRGKTRCVHARWSWFEANGKAA